MVVGGLGSQASASPARLSVERKMDTASEHPKKDHSGGLGDLLALGLGAGEHWTADELQAALMEHISTPLQFELGALGGAEAGIVRARAEAHGLVLRSLLELFQHPHPPLELLIMAKDFFKANSAHPQPGLPADVARTLYYLAIGIAWLRHQKRISSLSDAQVTAALDWVVQQSWVEEVIRALAAEVARKLKAKLQNGKK